MNMILKRVILVSIGLFFLVLGIVGYLVPGLPGTIWLIVAASLFVRSSDRLYNFVIQNRFFGGQVKDFLDTGKMSRRAQVMAVLFITLFSVFSIIFAPYGWLFKIPIAILGIVGIIYVLSRPTKE